MDMKEYNRWEMKKFMSIGKWIHENYPAMPLGQVHNLANIMMAYLKAEDKKRFNPKIL